MIRAAADLQQQADQKFVEACQAAAERDQLHAELEQIKAKRHSHQSTAMIEDLQAVMLDLNLELHQSYEYFLARLQNGIAILNSGRPGPYSYTSPTTDQLPRPARPGAGQKRLTGD